jgi:hypothetical protein
MRGRAGEEGEMHDRRTICLGLGLGLAALAAGCTTTAVAPGAGRIRMVQAVEAVDVQVVSRNPLVVGVSARGVVSSGGWSAPRLARGGAVDAQGILELAFIAEAPVAAPAGQGVQTVEAATRLDKLPPRLRGVRVLSQTNSVTETIQ